MSPTLNKEMTQVLEALEVDERCGVLVLTGAGDAFTAGMDLKEFFRESDVKSPEEWGQIARQAQIWQMQRLKSFPKPTIAMVNGWCFGGGFNPMISCDIAIAAEEATFGLSEVNWGIIPAGNVLRSIASKMRDTDGLYYALTGDTFNGKEAAAMGLVKFAVPRAELKAKTRELAVKLLAKNRAAVRAIKQCLAQAGGDVVGCVGGLSHGEARPASADRSRERPRAGHEAIPRREDLSPRPRPI